MVFPDAFVFIMLRLNVFFFLLCCSTVPVVTQALYVLNPARILLLCLEADSVYYPHVQKVKEAVGLEKPMGKEGSQRGMEPAGVMENR